MDASNLKNLSLFVIYILTDYVMKLLQITYDERQNVEFVYKNNSQF